MSETYLLCFDMETKKPFRLNIGTHQAQSLNDLTEQMKIQSKLNRQFYIMSQLLEINPKYEYQERNIQWNFDNQDAIAYRRSMLPFYLLEHEASIFPRYVDYSDLSKNLCQDIVTEIKIYLSPDLIKEYNEVQTQKNIRTSKTIKINEDTSTKRSKFEFQLKNVSLLQTASRLIKTATKEIYEELGVTSVKDNDNNKFKVKILKFKDYESYLYGEDQLIYFQEIRDHLRQSKEIELVLMIYEDRDEANHFPPLFNLEFEKKNQKKSNEAVKTDLGTDGGKYKSRGTTMKHLINATGVQHSEKNSSDSRNSQEEYIIQKYKKASIFFWYPPSSLPLDKTNFILNKLYTYEDSKNTPSFKKNPSKGLNRFINKQRPSARDMNNMTLNSYEINQPYEIKLLNLNNLTFNIRDVGREDYVELEKIFFVDNRTNKDADYDEKIDSLIKKCEDQSIISKPLDNPLAIYENRYLNHGQNYYRIQEIFDSVKFTIKTENEKKKKKFFKIQPKYIQIQSAIYFGSQQISDFSYTDPLVFNDKINFNQTQAFKKVKHIIDQSYLLKSSELTASMRKRQTENLVANLGLLKIKDLPNTARVGMNIILVPEKQKVKSKEKVEGYVFGSVSFPIFNQDRILNQGLKEVSFWPFTRFEPRRVCQGEYFQYKFKEEKENTYFYRINLMIQQPSFRYRIQWKLKDDQVGVKINDQSKDELDDGEVEIQLYEQALIDQPSKDGYSTTFEEKRIQRETEDLQKVKKICDSYPLEKKQKDYDGKLIYGYRNYIEILPVFIKSIDFTNQRETAICYDFIESSEQAKIMDSSEALALLDSEFGDSRVRLFAVQKLSFLNDSFISLYMPQLVQALKYELYHRSPLSEFLLERALKNLRVVGHALFWSVKANLGDNYSHERFYLILERFLMCCGKFKFQLYQQNLVNQSMISVFNKISTYKKQKDKEKKFNKYEGYNKLYTSLKKREIVMKLKLNLVLTHEKYDSDGQYLFNYDLIKQDIKKYIYGQPKIKKYYDSDDYLLLPLIKLHHQDKPVDYYNEIFFFPFEPKKPCYRFTKKSRFFLSKQLPLNIQVELQDFSYKVEENGNGDLFFMNQNKGRTMGIMFKFGDDLRQDGLVLQFFKLMDKYWMQNNLDMEMLAYNVMETAFKIGYIELVQDSETVAEIHKTDHALLGPFNKKSIYSWFEKNIEKGKILSIQDPNLSKKQLYQQYHDRFIKSLAGQCVATYVMGIKDRHSGNFMIQLFSGKFFHIDFGHILGHAKKKLGFKRDREPFIYSQEIHYFLKNFHNMYPTDEEEKTTFNYYSQSQVKDIQEGHAGIKSNQNQSQKKKNGERGIFCMGQSKQKAQVDDISDLKFADFEDKACRAFKVIRQNAHVFINLLMLMLVGGIHQINDETIKYLIDSLLLNKSDEEASSEFKKLINKALNTSYRKLDNSFHQLNDIKKGDKSKKPPNYTDQEVLIDEKHTDEKKITLN